MDLWIIDLEVVDLLLGLEVIERLALSGVEVSREHRMITEM